MKIKWKYVLLIIIIIISVGLLAFVGTKLYVKNNYDVKIVTDSGSSFFIFTTTHKKYYLVNSSLGVKTRTNEFDVKSDELSDRQLQQLEEIGKIDNNFSLEQYGRSPDCIFFYENFIFYQIYKSGPHISDEELKDAQESIYKYNIDTKQIEKIRVQADKTFVDVKLEALINIYPDLNEAISNKCGTTKYSEDVYSYGEVYYDKGRILFSTYSSGLVKGTTEYLYEYMPVNDKTKKVASTKASIVSIDIIE